MCIRQTVEQIYRDYERRDLEKVLEALSEDFCFEWPIDPKNSRFSGMSHGKGEFVAKLEDLANNFEFNAYRAITLIVEGDNAAAQILVDFTSLHTGERFAMRAAHFWTFKDEKPVHLVEYLDSALMAKQSVDIPHQHQHLK